MFIGLVERSLGLDHASQSQVGATLIGLLGVFVDATHALVSNIENEANDHGRLSKQGSSLDNVIVVKLKSRWVFIKLKRALNVAKVVVLELDEP